MEKTLWLRRRAALVASVLAASLALSACASTATTTQATGSTAATATPVANGAPGAPFGGAPPGGASQSAKHTPTGAYTLSNSAAPRANATITSGKADQSAILVTKSGDLTLVDPTITTSGKSSSADESSFYGLNAGSRRTAGRSRSPAAP